MPRGECPRHDVPCTCAMGQLYRFVEPVLLLMLAQKGRSYGYDLSSDLPRFAFTDAEIERAALYKTLRRLETNGYVTSDWDMKEPGPARRMYSLTASGKRHLQEWAQVLDKVAKSMSRFIAHARSVSNHSGALGERSRRGEQPPNRPRKARAALASRRG
ncbi:MAG: PadR family transcriptional regulator [Terriglobales bacterium]